MFGEIRDNESDGISPYAWSMDSFCQSGTDSRGLRSANIWLRLSRAAFWLCVANRMLGLMAKLSLPEGANRYKVVVE
jgi:hypothetical protein